MSHECPTRKDEQFIGDLQRSSEFMKDKVFSEDEALEIISYLVAVKENIEGLESKYLEL